MDAVEIDMASPVLGIGSEATVREAKKLQDKDIGALLVEGFRDFEGIVSEEIYPEESSPKIKDTTPRYPLL